MTARATACCLIAFAALLSCSRRARADAEIAAAPASPPRIVLGFRPGQLEAEAAVRAVRSHLSDLPVAASIEPLPEPAAEAASANGAVQPSAATAALGTFSFELGPEHEFLLFFAGAGELPRLVRTIRVRAGNERVALEEAAIIVRAMVEGLLDGKRGEVEVPLEQSAPAPSPAPQEVVPSRALAAAKLRYVGSSLAQDVNWQSGLALGLAAYPLQALSLNVAYSIVPKARADFAAASISLQRHPIEVSLEWRPEGTWAPLLALAGSADYVTRTTLGVGGELEASATRSRWLWRAGARAGGCFSPAARLHWCALAGVDALLTRAAYVVEGVDSDVALTLRTLAARVEAGLTIDVL